MTISVKAAGHLRQRMPDKRAEVTIDAAEASDTTTLLRRLGLNPSQVWIIRVNGIHVGADHPLTDGDLVDLFPLVGGG